MDQLRLLLYVSDIALPNAASDLVAIVQESRTNNERDDVSGLLVFDGSRFAQFVEGPDGSVQALRLRLERDPRHCNVEVLTWELGGQRRFSSWRMGYLHYDLDRFGLEGLRGQRGGKALEAFMFVLPTLDIDTGRALPTDWFRGTSA